MTFGVHGWSPDCWVSVVSARARMQDYHQLHIWHRGMAYAAGIYRFSELCPGREGYNLVLQLRKAASSVPLNIAEGSGCRTNREFARFVSYAYRSMKEVITCLELCERLYPGLPSETVSELIDEGNQISRMLRSFMRRLTAHNS